MAVTMTMTTTTTTTTRNKPKVRFETLTKTSNTKAKKKWNPVAVLLHNNPIHLDQPYRCHHFKHFTQDNEGFLQCPNFLDQQQKQRAIARLEEISRKDVCDITQQELHWLQFAFYCDSRHITEHTEQNWRFSKWFDGTFRALLKKKYGTYGVEWSRLRDRLTDRHGPVEETHTWVRWITIELLPQRKPLQEFLPWPVSGAQSSTVNPENIAKLYKRTMTTSVDGFPRTELEKVAQGIDFIKSEKKRWAPLQELFGEMKRVIAQEGYFCVVADLVETVWGVIGEMEGVLEEAGKEGYFPFNHGESPERERHLKMRKKAKVGV